MSEVTADQRIFSLILALLTTGERGSTKQALLSTVYGYADEYRWNADNASLERKFERDKEQLRELGIPLESYTPLDASGNNQETHYRIRKDVLQIPESLTFTDDELRMLNGAALMWQEGSLSIEARRARMKLGSLTDTPTSEPVAVTPMLTITEPAVHHIREAMTLGKDISFGYRKPGQRRQQRRAAPLRLHFADGRWHLIAFDYARDDYRTFLLSRMSGTVRIEDALFDVGLLSGAEAVENRLTELQRRQVATVIVKPGSRADSALAQRAAEQHVTREGIALTIHTLDMAALAEELLGYGEDARAIEPPELIDHLKRLVFAITKLHDTDRGR